MDSAVSWFKDSLGEAAWNGLPGAAGLTAPPRPSRPGSTASMVLLCSALLIAGGCASGPGGGAAYVSTGNPVADGLAMVEAGPSRDRVLWEYRTALAALRLGQDQQAAALLDDALTRLQGIFGPDAEARKSRRLFQAESKKTFLGEPYERAMAYFYRGIIYWKNGEPDNARACFLSAQFMDSDAEEKSYAGDYALLDYLEGLAMIRMGGDGSEALARARKVARQQSPPDYRPENRVLLFAESGFGPEKFATGEYQEQLRFRPGSSNAKAIRVQSGAQTIRLEPWDDLSFQATTRGGRLMDHVLANKAVFKETTDIAGNAAIIGGAIMASQRNQNSAVDEVGAGLIVAGLVSKVLSAATTPKADTRSWNNLPQFLYFGSMNLPPGVHRLKIDYLDDHDRPIAGASSERELQVLNDRDTVVFLSNHPPYP